MSERAPLHDPDALIWWWRKLHPTGDRLIGNLADLVVSWLEEAAPPGMYERQLHGVNEFDEEVFHADAVFLIEEVDQRTYVHLLQLHTPGDPLPPQGWADDPR